MDHHRRDPPDELLPDLRVHPGEREGPCARPHHQARATGLWGDRGFDHVGQARQARARLLEGRREVGRRDACCESPSESFIICVIALSVLGISSCLERTRPAGPAVRVAMTDFRLDKWYFDCVSADLAVLIGYAAKLKYGPIDISYGARITKTTDGPLSQRQSLSFGRVDEEPDCIRWSKYALRVAGTWIGGRRFESTVLVDGADGSIEWQCLGANSEVSVRVGGEAIEGLGYAERISVTIPPWRLPFRELRWGRYIGEDR